MGFVRRYFFSILLLLVAGAVLIWQPKEIVLQGDTMGTTYTVVAYKRGIVFEQPVADAVADRLKSFSKLFSTYDNESEISKINSLLGVGGMSISDPFYTMFELGDWLYRKTGGAWDGSILPLLSVWGFGPSSERVPSRPNDSVLRVAKSQVGWDKWQVKRVKKSKGWSGTTTTRTLYRSVPDAQLDFNSIAKGYGVDLIAEELESRGFQSYFVEIGGEVRVKGVKPSLAPWRVGLQTPLANRKSGEYFRILAVSNVAVATSGSYLNYWTDGVTGRRYSHLMDPRTGDPTISSVISATVIATDCAKADGLATALTIMEAEQGLQMIEQLEGIEALVVLQHSADVTPSVRQTSGFKRYDVTASSPGFRQLPF